MAGIDRDGLALLVMDLQNDFCHPGGLYGRSGDGFDHVPAAAAELLPRILAVSRACKSLRVPIVATKLVVLTDLDGRGIGLEQFRPQLRELFEQDGFRKGTWGQDLVDELRDPSCAPDYEVSKWGHSAMYLTGLEKVLRAIRARTLVLAGCGTNGVVEGTARDAVSRGWQILTLSDCVAAPNRQLHEGALLSLGHLGKTLTSAELLSELATT
jgi:ureidoacrylate peracid hydrolase